VIDLVDPAAISSIVSYELILFNTHFSI